MQPRAAQKVTQKMLSRNSEERLEEWRKAGGSIARAIPLGRVLDETTTVPIATESNGQQKKAASRK